MMKTYQNIYKIISEYIQNHIKQNACQPLSVLVKRDFLGKFTLILYIESAKKNYFVSSSLGCYLYHLNDTKVMHINRAPKS